jgi:hypothetical protein
MLPSELGCPPITKRGSRHSGFRDVANLRHRAKHSRHHTKDKQRFVVSVVAYDSLPGHQCYDIPRFSTTLYDATPVRERDVIRQLIDRSTLRWRSLVTWRGLIRRMSGYGMVACAKRTFDERSESANGRLSTNTRLSRGYCDEASQIMHLFWLYRPGARAIGVYVLAAPPSRVHKRQLAHCPCIR